MRLTPRALRRVISSAVVTTAALAAGSLLLGPGAPMAGAADHADGPNVAQDQGADLGDTYLFLDPNDNTKLVVIMTVHGFIVPGEAVNFAYFDPNVTYRFNFVDGDNTKTFKTIDVTFNQHTTTTDPQTITVKLPVGKKEKTVTGKTTLATLAAAPNPQTVTDDAETGVKVFAGETDDPFFFDIPAFSRFTASIKAGHPDPTLLQRGRDTFAGYNILSIAIEMPVALVKGDSNVIGLWASTLRKSQSLNVSTGEFKRSGKLQQIDREGLPGVNAVITPVIVKDRYNASVPRDDARGRFANDIVASLKSLGTDDAHINVLAGLVVTHGDILRLDTTKANSGPQGGTNPDAAFPNGRRLADDVIDTLLTVVANGTALGDNVNANDATFGDTFPFIAPPHQPRASGIVDDNTRN